MAKILSFRNKDSDPAKQDFLTDENQTLSFRFAEDGSVNIGELAKAPLSTLFPDPAKDWSNQELANLFRVRQLLNSANVPVETDRGITDEGDPWFVFCHINGDVFIHLCRIDGFYVLDNPNLLRPLRGVDFNQLIADFTNQALPSSGIGGEAERRVVRFERNGKVRLHPSTMLAALIWTLFLAAEELVLLAPDENAEIDEDALLNFDESSSVENSHTFMDALFIEEDAVDTSGLLKDGGCDVGATSLGTQDQLREVTLQNQGLTIQNSAVTMGLSTIAIAMGFMSETILLDNQRKVLENLQHLASLEDGSDLNHVFEHDIQADQPDHSFLALLADFLQVELSSSRNGSEPYDSRAIAADQVLPEQQTITHLDDANTIDSAEEIIKPVLFSNRWADAAVNDELPLERSNAQILAPEQTLPTDAGEPLPTAEGTQNTTSLIVSEIILTWQPKMEEFQLGETTIRASFDIVDTDTDALVDLIDTTTDQQPSRPNGFDGHFQQIIDFIRAKNGEIGIIEVGHEIIMIDRMAIEGGEVGFLNWETAEGKITLVGLATDFQQFDMIA